VKTFHADPQVVLSGLGRRVGARACWRWVTVGWCGRTGRSGRRCWVGIADGMGSLTVGFQGLHPQLRSGAPLGLGGMAGYRGRVESGFRVAWGEAGTLTRRGTADLSRGRGGEGVDQGGVGAIVGVG